MDTTRSDPCIDAGMVAAALRALGYAARSYSVLGSDGDPAEFGVAIHIVCTEAWRYPDGHWEIIDCPARLVTAPTAPDTWLFNHGVAVPEPTSAADLAAWVAAQLPPPDLPESRTYWQFSPPATPPAAAPARWARQWCEHWSRGGADLSSGPAANGSRHNRDLVAHNRAAP